MIKFYRKIIVIKRICNNIIEAFDLWWNFLIINYCLFMTANRNWGTLSTSQRFVYICLYNNVHISAAITVRPHGALVRDLQKRLC